MGWRMIMNMMNGKLQNGSEKGLVLCQRMSNTNCDLKSQADAIS